MSWGRFLGATAAVAFFGSSQWYRSKFGSKLKPGCYPTLPMSGRVVIVTGANSGIGKETAKRLARMGCKVVLACRSQAKASQTAVDIRETSHRATGGPGLGVAAALSASGGSVESMVLDLGDSDSVRAFVADFRNRYGRLDGLVNNAGCVNRDLQTNKDGTELTIAVNHVGPVLLTSLCLPLLEQSGTASRSSRIVSVSSRLERQGKLDLEYLASHRMTRQNDPKKGFEPMGAYADSKLCNLLYTRSLSNMLPPHVTATAVTPGMVNTGLFKQQPAWYQAVSYPFRLFYLRPADEAAEGVVFALTAASIEGSTGKYFADGVQVTPSDAAQCDDLAERLCKVTSGLIASGKDMQMESIDTNARATGAKVAAAI
eukprot:COSAG05_NODE_359_length_10803_cov_14.909193_6_plen_372_part_00